jgi:hypothetical protein
VWGFISNYLLLRVSRLPTTLLSLLWSLLRQAVLLLLTAITIMVKKNVSQQYYIFLLHFVLGMTIVSLMANATATTIATVPAMIYHCLFHDSNKTIVAIFLSFFR